MYFASLDGAACCRDEGLNRRGVVGAREGLLLGLRAAHDRDRKQLLVHSSVELQDLEDLLLRGREVGEGGVALMPQEKMTSISSGTQPLLMVQGTPPRGNTIAT